MLAVEHVPLKAAKCAIWQACHVLFAGYPLCFIEKLSCAQQVVIREQIVCRLCTRRLDIGCISKFGNAVQHLTTICGGLRHVPYTLKVGYSESRRSPDSVWRTLPSCTNAGKVERRIEVGARSPVFGDATGRVRKSMRRSGVRGTISVELFRLGGILLTCTIRLDVVYSQVHFFLAEVFQIAYFPLHLENDHILIKSAQVREKMYFFYIHRWAAKK